MRICRNRVWSVESGGVDELDAISYGFTSVRIIRGDEFLGFPWWSSPGWKPLLLLLREHKPKGCGHLIPKALEKSHGWEYWCFEQPESVIPRSPFGLLSSSTIQGRPSFRSRPFWLLTSLTEESSLVCDDGVVTNNWAVTHSFAYYSRHLKTPSCVYERERERDWVSSLKGRTCVPVHLQRLKRTTKIYQTPSETLRS